MANYEAERIGRLVDKQILSKIRLDQANKEKEVAQMKVEQATNATFTDGLFLHHYHCPF